jgi:hypothetical protein
MIGWTFTKLLLPKTGGFSFILLEYCNNKSNNNLGFSGRCDRVVTNETE